MTGPAFFVAVLRLALILVPAWLTARTLRWQIGARSAAVGALIEIVLISSQLVVLGELLGSFKALRFGWLTLLLFMGAVASWIATRRHPAGTSVEATGKGAGRTWSLFDGSNTVRASVALLLAVVAEQWVSVTANVFGGGMLSFDSLWYHMPFAARFAQSGSVTGVVFTQADPFVSYYSANSELLHAVGLLSFGNDTLSPLINLGWAAVVALACWCLGRPWKAERWTLLAGLAVLGLPVLSTTQPGQALNDITALAFMLAGLALLIEPSDNPGITAVGGLALGLALGTKLTFVVPVAVGLAATLILRPETRAPRRAACLLAATTLTGVFWYARNVIETGSPVGQRLQLGPLTLSGPASPVAAANHGNVLSQLAHSSLWLSRFAPGLSDALTPAWPLLILGGAAIGLLALTRGDARTRLLALTGAAALLTYLVVPAGEHSTGLAQSPFRDTLRYAVPALAIGAVLAATTLSRHRRFAHALGPAAIVVVMAGELHAHLWSLHPTRHFAFFAVGLLLGWSIVDPRPTRWVNAHKYWAAKVSTENDRLATRRRSAMAAILPIAGVIIIGMVGGYAIQKHYLTRRYRVGNTALDRLYTWAQQLPRTAIGIYGPVETYPLSGPKSATRVEYLGTPTDHGGYRPPPSCPAWRVAVNAAHLHYLVVGPAPTGPILLTWTATDPAAHLVESPGGEITVYALIGEMSPSTCN